jgi:hypothetical protein
MLGREFRGPAAVFSDRTLRLPTFCHLLIVNKLLSLSLSLSLSLCVCVYSFTMADQRGRRE